jgi:hypothetical protein
MAATWKSYPNGTLWATRNANVIPKVPDVYYDDPVQGSGIKNCSCIAGMASLAWVYPTKIKENLGLTTAKFQNGTAAMTSLLWLGDNNNFTYARSFEAPAPLNEIWPALYEKGFAKYVVNDLDPAQLPEPNMNLTAAQWGTPGLVPLVAMTGWAPESNITQNATADAILNKIKNDYCVGPDANGVSVMKYPGVAWTLNNPDTAHTYSILGVYQNYILIRDPLRPANAPAGSLTGNVWTVNQPTYNRGAPKSPAQAAQPLSLNNGTFGMLKENFKNTFYAYGVVK